MQNLVLESQCYLSKYFVKYSANTFNLCIDILSYLELTANHQKI